MVHLMNKTHEISKRQSIRDLVVTKIADGSWPPGSRIPTRTDFQRDFQATVVTVNSALRPLVQEGFLTASGKAGTRVHPMPPPFAHFALIFPEQFDTENPELKFKDAFLAATAEVSAEQGFTFHQYHQFSSHVDNPGYLRLAEDLRARRLAGILFVNWAYGIETTPLFAQIQLPMTAIVSHPVHPRVRTIGFDHRTLYREMALHLAACGSRHPAVIITAWMKRRLELLESAFAEARLEVPPAFLQFICRDHAWTAENVARLLFSLPPSRRPDGLLIGDDNLTDPVLTGAAAALGSTALAKLPLVTHVNFPLPPGTQLPGAGFGFDLKELLQDALREMTHPTSPSYFLFPVKRK